MRGLALRLTSLVHTVLVWLRDIPRFSSTGCGFCKKIFKNGLLSVCGGIYGHHEGREPVTHVLAFLCSSLFQCELAIPRVYVFRADRWERKKKDDYISQVESAEQEKKKPLDNGEICLNSFPLWGKSNLHAKHPNICPVSCWVYLVHGASNMTSSLSLHPQWHQIELPGNLIFNHGRDSAKSRQWISSGFHWMFKI